MSDRRPDDETLGRALGRAVESQTLRETPYGESRLAREVGRPVRGGWLGTLAAAAAIALFVAMGAFIVTRGPQGVAEPAPPASATISATASPAAGSASPIPSSSPVPTLVYFGRDGLPPVGVLVSGAAATDAAGQISARLTALVSAGDVASGAVNAARLTAAQVRTMSVGARIDGDLATVAIGIDGGWPARGVAQSQVLLQQLVYTITEQAGIRRAKITDKGGSPAVIDQLVLDKPLSREDVFGYAPLVLADRTIESGGSVVPANLSARIDNGQAGTGQPVRLVIDLAPRQPLPSGSGGAWLPAFVATMRGTTGSSAAKYEIEITVQGGGETTLRDQVIDVTPLRYVRVGANSEGTTYRVGVDDARPWRISIQPGTSGGMRIHVDIGGHPAMVNRNIAVYAPSADQSLSSSITIAGAARVYEANVSWRLRDANGREVARGFTTATNGSGPVWGSFQTTVPVPPGLSGRATLEVFWGSPRDGNDQDVVSIPLQVR